MKWWKKNYIGITEGKFKDWFTQHKHTFKNKSKSNATTLSAYAWDQQINSHTEIKWNMILKNATYINPVTTIVIFVYPKNSA